MSIRFTGHQTLTRAALLNAVVALLTACGDTAEVYYPLEPNRYWQYAVTKSTMDGEVRQKHVIATMEQREWNKRVVSVQQTLDGHQYFYAVGDGGIVQVARQLPHAGEITSITPPRIVLPRVRTAGVSWQRNSQTMVLESSGPPWETLFQLAQPIALKFAIADENASVRVAAGEFDHCLVIVGSGKARAEIGDYVGSAEVSVDVTQWYAPGVGLVKIERVETSDAPALKHGTLLMELESYR